MHTSKKIPIGKLLQTAGLVSDKQLETALETQSQYTVMKLGEILVLQDVISKDTVDFFVDEWAEIKEQGQQFPIGYYLKWAGLLSDKQIQTIVKEQKIDRARFGDLAVSKGWLKANTVEFFLDNLFLAPPRLISLISLEKYDRENLHLQRKYTNPTLILSRILAWTGGNPHLTKSICHVFADSNLKISTDMEVSAVDKAIETSLIKNWQSSELGAYIRAIAQNIVNSQRCEPLLLLSEYQEILLKSSKLYSETKEQQELLILGVVILEGDRLRVTNLIYQQIFNQNWIILAKDTLQKKILQQQANTINITKSSQDKTIKLTENQTDINNKTAIKTTKPLIKSGLLLTVAGITLLAPLILAINNYSFKQSPKNTNSISEASIDQFCNELNLIDPASSLSSISQLEKNKQKILQSFPKDLEVFPDNCETALNKLRILAAPQLGKENRVIEAIKNLCKIPADSENINEAKVWLKHWYNSANWGEKTQSYLNFVDDCPASEEVPMGF